MDEIEFSGTTDLFEPTKLYIDIDPEKDFEYLKSFISYTYYTSDNLLLFLSSVPRHFILQKKGRKYFIKVRITKVNDKIN